jgi:hypothetical protein
MIPHEMKYLNLLYLINLNIKQNEKTIFITNIIYLI